MALTIRLTEQEEQALERIKDYEHITTSSGVIRKLIANYENKLEEFKQVKQRNTLLEKELKQFKETAKDYFQASNSLQDMVYGDEWREEIKRRIDLYESGQAKTVTREQLQAEMDKQLNEFSN